MYNEYKRQISQNCIHIRIDKGARCVYNFLLFYKIILFRTFNEKATYFLAIDNTLHFLNFTIS